MNLKEPRKNLRILIVDDNPAIHADFAKILCPVGDGHQDLSAEAADLFGKNPVLSQGETFELDSAYQGEEALRMAEAAQAEGRPYAVAFMDVRMPPGWDGVETICRIWESCPDMQMVICTAYSDHSWDEIIDQVGRAESLLILKKPFDNVEVLQMAHALTEKWALNEELKGQLSNLETLVAERTRDLEATNASLRCEAAERERAQVALLRSEERFSKAFHANPVPISLHTVADGRFVDANPSFLEMTGHTRAELLTLSTDVLRQTYDTAQVPETEPARSLPGTIQTKSGAVRETLISTELIMLCGQTCVLTLFLDVTEQRLLERKLRRAEKLESLGQLAAGIAHNFNNILGVILGHASLQLDSPGAGNVDRAFQEIANAAERGAGLVRQLMAAGQQQKKQNEVLDLNELVARTKHLLAPLLGQSIAFMCEPAAQLPKVEGDHANLEQVLLNLVLNARDAMPKGGSIRIRTREVEITEQDAAARAQARPGTYVRLSVVDSGTGMDDATLERIFEPFFTTKGVGGGTGLGLATVHGIVAQHGGWIEVTSALGRGSAFDVFLPAAQRDPSALPPAAPKSEPAKKGETVLLVEDEPGLRHVAQLTLERSGYRVLLADDGRKALSIWSQQQKDVDLLLTDLSMPGGVSGYELAEQIRANRPSLPVIFASGFAPGKSPQSLAQDQAAFLQKPYTADTMLRTVRACLDAA